ncbi:MAG TPA: nucleotidyltransferase domain-containing protein, partial [Bryobacteraceae bacterium]
MYKQMVESQQAALGEIADGFEAHHDPCRVFDQRTALVDQVVISTVDEHLLTGLRCPFAVVAVGGYGRRELFPYSDIDLLVVFENEADLAGSKEELAEFCRVLWDAGLQLSYSVRTIGECCRMQEGNTELHISLLDTRFLRGSEFLFTQLSKGLSDFYKRSGAMLVSRLAKMARGRHKKYNDTAYHLEQNIKESPGGVRDIHLLHWLRRLDPGNSAVEETLLELTEARSFLYTLRCFLHFQTGRDNNLLTFELQDSAS